MELDLMQLPSWFMAVAISVLCLYTGYSLKKDSEKRDALIARIAQTIYGSEDKPGLLTRISVMENTVDRCGGCTPGEHHTGGKRWYDPEARIQKDQYKERIHE